MTAKKWEPDQKTRDRIASLVAAAPPLTEEQKDKLRVLLERSPIMPAKLSGQQDNRVPILSVTDSNTVVEVRVAGRWIVMP